jgi:hypothetical protein
LSATQPRLCARCVLPHAPPDIQLDEQGVCNICRKHEAEEAAMVAGDRGLLETDLIKILDKVRGKRRYDCLCMLSGGKDSTAALYYLVRRYRLNPLVFTFNHGFVPADHIAGARRSTRRLGVDHLVLHTSFMKEMFRTVIETDSKVVICPICSLWYMLETYKLAARFEIPIIVSGWTKGQTTGSTRSVMSRCACDQNPEEFTAMAAATRQFMAQHVRTNPRYRDFPATMDELLGTARRRYKSKAMVLSPHWFVPEGPEEYVPVIQRELGWRPTERSYPKDSTNCELNFLSVQRAQEHYGYSVYTIEMSNMIRLGLVSREEALHLLELDFDPALLSGVLRRLGLPDEGPS